MSDGKEAKFIFLDDLHDTKVADFSKLEEIGKQWYEHCVVRSNFALIGGTVMSVKDFDKFTSTNKTETTDKYKGMSIVSYRKFGRYLFMFKR